MMKHSNNMMLLSKRLIRLGLRQLGFDVIRMKNNPLHTLLGLKSKSIGTIIDVGANTGQFARRVSDFFPDARIYCFEPLPGPFVLLSAWAETREGRVSPHNVCVGDKEDELEMYFHEDHSPSSSLLVSTRLNEEYYPFTKRQRRILVKQKTLDGVLGEIHAVLAPEVLIKLDVQGYEKHVLAGGPKAFARASACIVEVNLDVLYEGQADFRELLVILENLGYRYSGNLEQTYGEDGHCVFCDAVFLKPTGEK